MFILDAMTKEGTSMILTRSHWESLAFNGTKTARKDRRRWIRHVLGTSRDQAPTAREALVAAQRLSLILDDATAGKYYLAVVERGRSEYQLPGAVTKLLAAKLEARFAPLGQFQQPQRALGSSSERFDYDANGTPV